MGSNGDLLIDEAPRDVSSAAENGHREPWVAEVAELTAV